MKPDHLFNDISRPKHYAQGRIIEPINVIEDWNLGYHEGNILKYLSRWQRKGDGKKDLLKARYYLDRLIDLCPEEQSHDEKVPTKVPVRCEDCHQADTA